MAISISEESLDKIKLQYIRKELSGYYTGSDLDTHTVQTLLNFRQADANPLKFQFMEESRVNQETMQVETWMGWQLKGADYGSVLIKD